MNHENSETNVLERLQLHLNSNQEQLISYFSIKIKQSDLIAKWFFNNVRQLQSKHIKKTYH